VGSFVVGLIFDVVVVLFGNGVIVGGFCGLVVDVVFWGVGDIFVGGVVCVVEGVVDVVVTDGIVGYLVVVCVVERVVSIFTRVVVVVIKP
jgi:hypothetical protein